MELKSAIEIDNLTKAFEKVIEDAIQKQREQYETILKTQREPYETTKMLVISLSSRYNEVHEKIIEMEKQHENEIKELKQQHEKDIQKINNDIILSRENRWCKGRTLALTDREVIQLRTLLAEGMTQREVAKEIGVSVGLVNKVSNDESYTGRTTSAFQTRD